VGRRTFLRCAVGAAFGLAACAKGRAQSAADVLVRVGYEDAGQEIAPDFTGLSYESAILAPGDYFAPNNASVVGLIRLLGASGVVRIGGNTSADALWRAAAAPARAKPAATGTFVITPASIDRLAATMRMLSWKVIYGLDLARSTPEDMAEQAAYVARALGTQLLAFQIGNEPDGFGRWSALRPKTYDVAAYLAEWRKAHAAIRARVPDARFAGPDVAGTTDWVAALAETKPEGLVLLTLHYYADGPAGAPHVSLAKLLRSGANIVPTLEALARDSRTFGLPYRIAEANSIFNEGQPGVSDTLGAALWGAELMFQVAAAGGAGVNFHAGIHNRDASRDKAYTPIARASQGRHRAAPLYYGMLMFAQAARGVLIPARVTSSSSDLAAFAVRAHDGTLRLCLINKDAARAVRVTVDAGRNFGAASVMRLIGPAIDAKTGITLGGASVDELGGWTPAASEPLHPINRAIVIDVPAGSAAVVSTSDRAG